MNQKKKDLHIKELNIIEGLQSPHRTRVFIVNKHSEIIRGNSRIIFNYKRFNDNTKYDKYSLPNKEALIKMIKNTYIYM